MNDRQVKHQQMLRQAFDEYLNCLYNDSLNPCNQLLDYNFDFLCDRKWRALGLEMIHSDLKDLTNILNRWNQLLQKWHAWNVVLNNKKDGVVRELQYEFIESLVYECLFMPASLKDTITDVSTSSFHQVKMALGNSYRDFLDGDPITPTESSKILSRKRKENRLKSLIEDWLCSDVFINKLYQINNKFYVDKTSNYRNLRSHAIAPSFNFGYTKTVTRSVIQREVLEEQESGGFLPVKIPDAMCVSYSFGGTPPLDLSELRLLNLEQYTITRDCYLEYRSLLKAKVEEIPFIEN